LVLLVLCSVTVPDLRTSTVVKRPRELLEIQALSFPEDVRELAVLISHITSEALG
jgi:hypothetical protein